MTKACNFTVATINSLPSPSKGRIYYKDSKEPGLVLLVTHKGYKSFYLRKRVKGADARFFIGAFGDVTIEGARKQAKVLKGQIASGKVHAEAKRNEELKEEPTFGQHFVEYMERYSKPHKKSWKYDEREVNRFLSHWFNVKLSSIKKGEIQKLILKIYDESGLYQANRILERIRTIYNKAIEWGWEGVNPTVGIKKYREKKRDRFIMPDEIPYFFEALESDSNPTARDYIMILLLVGQRKTNVLMMRWDEINWEHQFWRIPETKNGDPVIVPLTSAAIDILQDRKATSNSEWVFPSEKDPNNHFSDPSRSWERIRRRATLSYWSQQPTINMLINEGRLEINPEVAPDLFFKRIIEKAETKGIRLPTGILDVRMHDIRRTFGSYQAITGASLQVIGKSLGHKSTQATEIYARLNLDPIRASVEKGVDAMLSFKQRKAA